MMNSEPIPETLKPVQESTKPKGKGRARRAPFDKRRSQVTESKRHGSLDRRTFVFSIGEERPRLFQYAYFNVRCDRYPDVQDVFYETYRPLLRDIAIDIPRCLAAHKRIINFLIMAKFNNANNDGQRLFFIGDLENHLRLEFQMTLIDQLIIDQIGRTTRLGGGVQSDCFPLPLLFTLPDNSLISFRKEGLRYQYNIGGPPWLDLAHQGYNVPYPGYNEDAQLSRQWMYHVKRFALQMMTKYAITPAMVDGGISQLVTSEDARAWSSYPMVTSDFALGHCLGFGYLIDGWNLQLKNLRSKFDSCLYVHELSRDVSSNRVLTVLDDFITGSSRN